MGKTITRFMKNNLTSAFIQLVISLLAISACNGINNQLSKQFSNLVSVDKKLYLKDSLSVIINLKKSLEKHEGFFNSNEYFDSTQVIIDTMIYSSDLKKLAIFVIIKNSTKRQLVADQRSEFYYNGNCFLGNRKNDSVSLYSIGPSSSNSTNKNELSKIMRNTYFTKYATVKDANGKLKYKYNIGDIRFWTCSIWSEVEDERLRKIKFEKEKKEHPENVYDRQ